MREKAPDAEQSPCRARKRLILATHQPEIPFTTDTIQFDRNQFAVCCFFTDTHPRYEPYSYVFDDHPLNGFDSNVLHAQIKGSFRLLKCPDNCFTHHRLSTLKNQKLPGQLPYVHLLDASQAMPGTGNQCEFIPHDKMPLKLRLIGHVCYQRQFNHSMTEHPEKMFGVAADHLSLDTWMSFVKGV